MARRTSNGLDPVVPDRLIASKSAFRRSEGNGGIDAARGRFRR
jgi:hypothetical protein